MCSHVLLTWNGVASAESARACFGRRDGAYILVQASCAVQVTDLNTTENNSFLQYHKYPSLEGTDREDWKEGVNRITAHTDESLMTLLLTSPGAHTRRLLLTESGARVGQ